MTDGKINLLNGLNSEVYVQVSILLILELRFNKTIHSHRKNYGLCTFKENSKKNMGRGRDEGMNEKTLPSPSSGISDYSEINDAYACRYLGLWTLTKTCTQKSTPLSSIPKLTSGHQIKLGTHRRDN